MLVGIISGIVSGTIVALVAVAISYFRQPRFELCYANENTVTLHHRRLRPVVIGGTWEFGNSSALLSTPDNRAGTFGILVKGHSSTNFRNAEPPCPIGAVISISYKRAPLFLGRNSQKRHEVTQWAQEPSELIDEPGKKRDGWKLKALRLRHA